MGGLDAHLVMPPLIDEGVFPVLNVDPVTKKAYCKSRSVYFGGRQRYKEWFKPDGSLLCRMEFNAQGANHIVYGSLQAVRDFYGPDVMPDKTMAEAAIKATDEPFDCMRGVDLARLDDMLTTSRNQDAPVLARLEAEAKGVPLE